MTSKQFCNYHPLRGLFLHTLKKQSPIVLLAGILMLLICPGLPLRDMFEMLDAPVPYALVTVLDTWSTLICVMAGALVLILLIHNHSHLFSRKMGDLYFALPVRREGLLLAKAGASALGAWVPMTLCFLGLLLCGLSHRVFAPPASHVIQLWLMCSLMLLMVTAFFLLLVICSGGIFDLLLSVAVVNIGLPMLGLIAEGWFADTAKSVVFNRGDAFWLHCSPLLYAMKVVEGICNRPADQSLLQWKELASCGLQTAVYLALALGLFRKRKAEKAESGFAFAFVPGTITVIAAACGGYCFYYLFEGWFWAVIGALLCAVILGAIFSRGLQRWKQYAILGLVAAVVLGGIYLGAQLLGERAEHYIPEASIEPTGTGDNLQVPEEYVTMAARLDFTAIPAVNFTGDLSLVTMLHQICVAESDGSQELQAYYSAMIPDMVYITYTMEDGSLLRRYYSLNTAEAARAVLEIMKSEAYAEALTFDEETRYVHLKEPQNATFSSYNEGIVLSVEEAQALVDSYLAELADCKDSVLFNEVREVQINALGDPKNMIYYYMRIPLSFKNTLALWDGYVADHLE